MKTMDEAHRSDYAAKRELDDLRQQITGFLADPPSRLGRQTREALEQSVAQLQKDSDHVVQVWN